MSRRKKVAIQLAAIVSGLTLIGGLTACTSSGGDSSSSDKVTITLVHWDPNQLKYAFTPAIAAFEKQNPNITVKAQQIPYGQYLTKIQTGMASGTAPDLFVTLPNTIQQFEANKTVLDLAADIKKDKVDLSKYAPFSVENFEKGSHNYGIPWTVNTVGTYYNMDELKKAGINSIPSKLTWAPDGSGTLIPFMQKLTIDANGVSADQPGFDPDHVVQWGMGTSPDSTQGFADEFMAQNGGGYQEKPNGPPTINSAANVEAYQFISDLMYKYHVAPPGATVIAPNAGAEQTQFLSGQIATLQGGDWLISAVQAGAKFKWGIGPNLTGPKGQISTISSGGFSLSAGTKHQAEAWKLAKYLSGSAGQKIMASSGSIQPAITSLGPVYAAAWEPKGVDPTPFTVKAVGKVIPLPSGPNIDAVQTATDSAVAAIYLKTSSVKVALDAAQKAAMAAFKGNG